MPDYAVRVGLAKEVDRRTNVHVAMQRVKDDILAKLKPQILIKPNFFSAKDQLTSTHPDAVRGVLDFLVECNYRPTEVLIAEGSPGAGDAYQNHGYDALEKEYDFPIRWTDLSQDRNWLPVEVRLADDTIETVRIPQTILEHPCIISVALAKTHDADVVTLAQKNLIMGSIHQEDRIKIHGYHSHRDRSLPREAAVINANLFRMSRYIRPMIAVVDGTVGIQGNGPGGKDSIQLGIAVASNDVFAADAVMAQAMGFDPQTIGLFVYAQEFSLGITDLEQIQVIGPPLKSVIRPFKPPETYRLQLQWQNSQIESMLAASMASA